MDNNKEIFDALNNYKNQLTNETTKIKKNKEVGETTKSTKPRKTKKEKLQELVINTVNYNDLHLLDEGYNEKIHNDNKYSLEVDPDNLYNLSDEHKLFIQTYVKFKNLAYVSNYCGIKYEICQTYLRQYSTKNEVRRLNLALKARQFSTKMLSLDEIGGYLTSLIINDDLISIDDKLSGKDKLSAVKMLIELNQLKKDAYENPKELDVIDVESEIKNLSVKSIKSLLSASQQDELSNEKTEIISKINIDNNLTDEEINVLNGMNKDELLKLLEEINTIGGK